MAMDMGMRGGGGRALFGAYEGRISASGAPSIVLEGEPGRGMVCEEGGSPSLPTRWEVLPRRTGRERKVGLGPSLVTGGFGVASDEKGGALKALIP